MNSDNMQNMEIENEVSFSRHTSNGVTVLAVPMFMEDESQPDENRYVWACHLRVENNTGGSIRLVGRYCTIAGADGVTRFDRRSEIDGGFPVIGPGGAFEYTSGTPLQVPSALLMGKIGVVNEQGESFEVDMPVISLDSPYEKKTLN